MGKAGDSLPIFVVYNIPHRDCGGLSAGKGGAATPEVYKSWITGISRGLGGRQAIIILEPDTLGQMVTPDCPLTPQEKTDRISLLQFTIDELTKSGGHVYVETSMWPGAANMARQLQMVGRFGKMAGVSIGASGYVPIDQEVNFFNQLAGELKLPQPLHGVIETSRNGGKVAAGAWCNPVGAKIGPLPTINSGLPEIDALLWEKNPLESDGTCNSGPPAGQPWVSRAKEMVNP
ncbi:glycoside hydrolase family 6 protein [Candidatus Microgenomates bacterium]|nr:glycoside hydrolase family 6 protein [Candidatus Microgenomates bacterium]